MWRRRAQDTPEPAYIVRTSDGTHVVECPVHGVLPETRHVFGPMLYAHLINHSHCRRGVAADQLPPL